MAGTRFQTVGIFAVGQRRPVSAVVRRLVDRDDHVGTLRAPILDELRTRQNLKRLSEFHLDILYAQAKTKLWSKIERLRGVPGLSVADFGTRRRHSFLWQEYVVKAMASNLGRGFIGTSNAFLAHKHDLEAIGTNAHEIPMVLAALARDDAALRLSQYQVLKLWQETYEGALRIMLPDTFGK